MSDPNPATTPPDSSPASSIRPWSRTLWPRSASAGGTASSPPMVTLWAFLSQVLCPDHSCRAAVARLIATLTARGQAPCSPETGPYCKARQRLPGRSSLRWSVGQA